MRPAAPTTRRAPGGRSAALRAAALAATAPSQVGLVGSGWLVGRGGPPSRTQSCRLPPAKPGVCPRKPASPDFAPCPSRCEDDRTCPGDEKCCFTGCGLGCVSPYKGTDGAARAALTAAPWAQILLQALHPSPRCMGLHTRVHARRLTRGGLAQEKEVPSPGSKCLSRREAGGVPGSADGAAQGAMPGRLPGRLRVPGGREVL